VADPASQAEYCFLAIQHWSLCMGRAEWAAWFQAIGSVAAVVSGVVVVWWQTRERRVSQWESEVRRLRMIGDHVHTAHFCLEWFMGFVALSNRAPTMNVKAMRPSLDALSEIPVFDVPHEPVSTTLSALRSDIAKLYAASAACSWPTAGSIDLAESSDARWVVTQVRSVMDRLEKLAAEICDGILRRNRTPAGHLADVAHRHKSRMRELLHGSPPDKP
jgi:hypothetical protein